MDRVDEDAGRLGGKAKTRNSLLLYSVEKIPRIKTYLKLRVCSIQAVSRYQESR